MTGAGGSQSPLCRRAEPRGVFRGLVVSCGDRRSSPWPAASPSSCTGCGQTAPNSADVRRPMQGLRRSGTKSSPTLRWRETDSNLGSPQENSARLRRGSPLFRVAMVRAKPSLKTRDVDVKNLSGYSNVLDLGSLWVARRPSISLRAFKINPMLSTRTLLPSCLGQRNRLATVPIRSAAALWHRARTAQRGRHHREGLKVCGLSAGESWIRTFGPSVQTMFLDTADPLAGRAGRSLRETAPRWDFGYTLWRS
jgi:hypothetical protein